MSASLIPPRPVVLVTGASSGLGLAAALALKEKGCTVYALSRRGTAGEGLRSLIADVTDEAQINAAVAQVLNETKRIDILLCCAGFGISGAVEFVPMKEAIRQLDVNLFGTVRTIHAVLPVMRKQGAGRIVCLSSMASVVAIPFQSYYSASKAAMNNFIQALRCEVRPFGISVCAIMPGDIRTGFTDAREKYHEGDDLYFGRISRGVAAMEHDERRGMDATAVAARIAALALKKRIKPLYAIGLSYKLICLLVAVLPAGLRCRIIGRLYG